MAQQDVDMAGDIDRVAYYSLSFILCAFGDMMRHYPFDALDLILTHCVISTNVEHLIRNTELDRRYLEFAAAEPVAIKRGVSRGALSRFLNVPEETIRRRVSRLKRMEVLAEMADGLVIAPSNPYRFGSNPDLQASNARLVRKMFRAIRSSGVRLNPDLDDLSIAKPAEDDAVMLYMRGISRHSLTYILCAFSDMMRFYALDTLDLIITQTIVNRNIVHVDFDPYTDKQWAGAQPPETPGPSSGISRLVISRFLHIPQETTRRRVERLIETGLVAEQAGNLMITQSDRHRFQCDAEVKAANYRLVRKMHRNLKLLGIDID